MEGPQSAGLLRADSDRPVEDPGADKFGFVEIAKRLAPALVEAMDQDGLVIGIEGVWGSGKTSLVNYVRKEIAALAGDSVEIIHLAPWLSGDDESLVATLLGRIAEGVEKRDEPGRMERAKRILKKKSKGRLPTLLRRYGAKTGRVLSPVLKMGGAVIPGLSAAGDVASLGSDALEGLGKLPTNAQMKEAIAQSLQTTNCRFLVILDDLDRLEPAQAVEVIRLVRSVADFPRVLYLMCYDRGVLAHALERGLGVENGDLFLRKIVQQTFAIPLPEPFDLRLNFTHDATRYFERVNGRVATKTEQQDIRAAVEEWGGRLRTPRDVKLALNGVKFHYMPVKESVHFPDVCRVQLMRVVEPEVYNWLEEYLGEYSVIATGDGRVSRADRKRMGKRLKKLFSDDPDTPRSRWTMRELVPGLKTLKSDEPEGLVYGETSAREMRELVDAKRLGSPFHYRYYFALAPARTVLPDTEYKKVLDAALHGREQVGRVLADLYRSPRHAGGNWLSQFFNRLDGFTGNGCSPAQIQNLMLGITDIMDEVLRGEDALHSRHQGSAREAEDAMGQLYRYLASKDEKESQQIVLHVLEYGGSVTWLCGYFMRSEFHRHGMPDGRQATYPEGRMLSSDSINHAIRIVRARMTKYASDGEIVASPDLAMALYGWRDSGADADARSWAESYVKVDENFVDFLLRMRSWAMSDRVYLPLHRKSVANFLNIDDMDARLARIAEGYGDGPLGKRAREVIEALKLARDIE